MFEKILVPIDGSDASTMGLHKAIELAKGQDTEIRLIHIVGEFFPPPAMGNEAIYAGTFIDTLRQNGKSLVKEAKSLVEESGVRVEADLIENVAGRTADLIVEEAKSWKADLIVLGTHGRRGLRRLVMGSDAEEVVRTSPVPVLLVRA